MNDSSFGHFLCPVCGLPLLKMERTMVCENRHSFDLSRNGYVNLLLNQKHGGHGDDRPMIRARTLFLEGGYYLPLVQQVIEVLKSRLSVAPVIVDAGCGEGWYTEAIFKSLSAEGKLPKMIGLDISRDALLAACKRHFPADFAVASLFRIPVQSVVADAVLNIFAPECSEEFFRILKPGGVLIKVIPLEDHLIELKRSIYTSVYENPAAVPDFPGFSAAERFDLRYEIFLPDFQMVSALFTMTPYYHKTSEADREKLNSLHSLKTTAAFAVLVYTKNADSVPN